MNFLKPKLNPKKKKIRVSDFGHGLFIVFSTILIIGLVAFGFYGNLTGSTEAATGINKQISYQGRLLDDDGAVVADGNYDMKFSIYDNSAGGTCLWTVSGTCAVPTVISVGVSRGYFSVMLGSSGHNTIDLDFNDDTYWLGVTVRADSEMTPRKRIGAAGYAFNTDTFGGFATSSFLRTDAVSTSTYNTVFATSTGTGVHQGSIYINPPSASTNYALLGVSVGAVEKFKLDAEGDLTIQGIFTSAGFSTSTWDGGTIGLSTAVVSGDFTAIGSNTPGTGTFTTLTTTSNTDIGDSYDDTLTITSVIDGALWASSTLQTTGLFTPYGGISTSTWDGGTIGLSTAVTSGEFTAIGGNTPGTGAFTTLTTSGATDLGNSTDDTLTITARIDSDVDPSTNDARDLGQFGNAWSNIYSSGTIYGGDKITGFALKSPTSTIYGNLYIGDSTPTSGWAESDETLYVEGPAEFDGEVVVEGSNWGILFNNGSSGWFDDDTWALFGEDDDAIIEWNTDQTNDALVMGLGNSFSLLVVDKGDEGTDLTHTVQHDPTIFIHSSSTANLGLFGKLNYNKLSLTNYDATATSTFAPDRITLYDTVSDGVGKFYADSSGNFSASGTAHIHNLTGALVGDTAICRKGITGEITASVGTNCNVSSRRFKYDIQPQEDIGLEIVMQLLPVSFKQIITNKERLGLIAEDVSEIDERLINFDSDGLLHSVRYDELTSVLVKAIQEQNITIEELKEKVLNYDLTIQADEDGNIIQSTSPHITDIVVDSIVSSSGDWSISEGNFITEGVVKTEIETEDGEKQEMYAVTSPDVEFMLSGSAVLENGEARIVFEENLQKIISPDTPIKVSITPTAPDIGFVYVTEKGSNGFKIIESSPSDDYTGTLDWIVIAKRKGFETTDPYYHTEYSESLVVVEGCMEPGADNYNPNANIGNNSCIYSEVLVINGCMDSEAINYNPDAIVDNKTCNYASEILAEIPLSNSLADFTENPKPVEWDKSSTSTPSDPIDDSFNTPSDPLDPSNTLPELSEEPLDNSYIEPLEDPPDTS